MPRIAAIYEFGPFQLDTSEHRLLRDGVEVPLQLKAFETLCILVERAGRLLTKEELLRQVWPGTMVEENNLNKNISLLRKAMGGCANGESYIETVPRVGFRFTAAVSQAESLAASHPATNNGAYNHNGASNHTERAPQTKSIAVLYFENLSGNKEDEYFRDGMTEDVITELEKIRGLRLFPRSTVLAFRDTPLPITEVGRQLNAAFVLEGSIRRAGERLRITARLAETSTGHSVWTERYDRRMEDVFAIQDEIAQSIALALRVVLTEKEKHEIQKVPTRNIQAYDYYLRGRQFFYQLRRQSLEYARQMFARAIVIDPDYARAYAGVADCCSFLYMWFAATEDNLREALAASRRAVELDSQSPVARASLGLAQFLNHNYEAARDEFETALGLCTELFEAYYFYGRSCFAQGQFEKAAHLFAQAAKVSPDDFQSLSLRGLCFRALGRKVEARQAFTETLERVERHLQLHPDDVRAVYMKSGALCGLGQNELALEWADRALAMDPEEPSVLYNVACDYALLGHTEKAIDCLAKSLDQGFGHTEWIEHDPDLASVRAHPRFLCLKWQLDVGRHCVREEETVGIAGIADIARDRA
ncbi:MAG TPA: tetratricopeptide repeat protein [Candidatus Angelobacter sp.]|nr:tetratricopeptide repeat protein [Candidatus Angelobacter sp.]